MADEINSGGASSATEAPASAPDPGQAIKDAALGQMARSEDAEDYIKERQSRLAEERGETTPEVRDEDRADRIRKALTEAREETEKARQANGLDQKPNLDTAFEDAQAEWAAHQQEEQQFGQEREAARAEGKFQA